MPTGTRSNHSIPKGWTRTTIGRIARLVTGKTPSTGISSNFDGSVPFVTPRDFNQGRTIFNSERTLSERGLATMPNCRVPPRSVMVYSIGMGMGGVAMTGMSCVTNQQIISIVVNEGTLPEFVFYDLSSRREELRQRASAGSAQLILTKGGLSQVPIDLPPYSEQRAIARVLGSLDDKIDLNRGMNQTLEEICRALFKFWFVDFGPVRAKAEGRWKKGESLPGMPADMWDLWPSEFEESEIGEIPKGWDVRLLAEVADISQGNTPSTEVVAYWIPPEHPWVTVKDLSQAQNCVLTRIERKVSQRGLETLGSKVVTSGSILLSTGAPIGYVAIATTPLVLGTRVAALHPWSPLDKSYLLQWTRVNVGAFREVANGTTFPQLLLSTLRDFPILVPPARVISRFETLLSPLQARVVANVAENVSLASTRDTLLPKLLSGEIRLKVNS